jgi:ribonuclease-3
MKQKKIEILCEKIGYTFINQNYLIEALTHPSVLNIRRKSDFERLEFLGDRVLGLVMADLLFKTFPKEKEGDLAKRQAALVRREACLQVARTIHLIDVLEVVAGDVTPHSAVLGDAVEALIGAIYLDGGITAAQTFIHKFWANQLEESIRPPKDGKTALQEWSQARSLGIPEYQFIHSSGPAHAPEFIIRVVVGPHQAEGTGPSKRQAEQIAANNLLKMVQKK